MLKAKLKKAMSIPIAFGVCISASLPAASAALSSGGLDTDAVSYAETHPSLEDDVTYEYNLTGAEPETEKHITEGNTNTPQPETMEDSVIQSDGNQIEDSNEYETQSDVQSSEIAEDNQTQPDEQPSESAEDNQTQPDGQPPESAEDNQIQSDENQPEDEDMDEGGTQSGNAPTIPKLITDVHKVYVSGTGHGLFNPEGTLSRAQAASIIFTLLEKTDSGDLSVTFSDVKDTDWFANAVNVCASHGIINGSNGKFRPNAPITRAEFVTILSKFSEMQESSTVFPDVPPESWYAPYVANAFAQGWVSGYADGNFHPEAYVSRAAAVTIINRMLGRTADKGSLSTMPEGRRYYADVPVEQWYYADVMEASIAHGFNSDAGAEVWELNAPLSNGLADGLQTINGKSYKVESGAFVTYPDGFNTIDGIYCHVSDGCAIDNYAPGFHTIEGKVYHFTKAGPSADKYNPGFNTIDGFLRYVSEDGYAMAKLAPGANIINNLAYIVSDDGYTIKKFEPGLVEAGSDLYYASGDGHALLTNTSLHYLTFGADGKYSSGNEKLDAYVHSTLAACVNGSMTQEEKRRAVYLYIRDHSAYRAYSHSLYGCNKRGAVDWAEQAAITFFDNGFKGNCYMFAAAFLYCVRQLGYSEAYPVSGGVGSNNADHSWVMMDGKIYDVELEYGYRAGKYGSVRNVDLYGTQSGSVFSYHFQ